MVLHEIERICLEIGGWEWKGHLKRGDVYTHNCQISVMYI